ncbi:MAG: hypothetical protein RMM98_17295 [Acidobacteriota bacterium]|nr:hypothetical protein [Blastocatellia bacterium]MDW8241359.1 hypothetical protein [Acidobacteriota bacterium]
MRHKILVFGLGLLLLGLLWAAPAPTKIQAQSQGCTTIDFEGVADTATGALIGDFYAHLGVTFETFDTWRGVAWDVLDKRTHADAVCSAIPSGNKVGHLSLGNPRCGITSDTAPGAAIWFQQPVQSVKFKYASCNTVYLEAFNNTGASLGIVSGLKTNDNKPFCNFRELSIQFQTCVISKVEIRGVALIDDLQFCCPPQQPQDCCPDRKKKPRMLTMRYTGEDCSASNHAQAPGKVTCTGNPNFASPVRIRTTNKSNPNDSKAKVWFDGTVNLNETFVIDAGREKHLKSDTYVFIYSTVGNRPLLQTVKFHTSCSQPLRTGDQFGSLVLEACGVDAAEPDPCEGGVKPQSLTLEYTAEDCSATDHSQDPSKVSCTDFGRLTSSVFIRATDEKDGLVWFQGTVLEGQTFIIDARNAGKTRLGTNTRVEIFASQGGPLLQRVIFHTSCSQPLINGDQYGSLVLRGGVYVPR